MEDAAARLNDAMEDVFQTLLNNGVPNTSIDIMKKSIMPKEKIDENKDDNHEKKTEDSNKSENDHYISVLLSAQEHTKCYPYMDANGFVNQLYNAWDALCNQNVESLRLARRKVMIMKADPKADPDALIVAENTRNEKA
eukprot:3082540-Ditylum_brightwellii.AAC.1